ncbi:hypothetical protein [uncultured Gilliamella sp.]|uniref:hypothetical protein n=1 Tax=uncultured Gilliamella sp. TaxID=1193505 RepID=UPI0025D3D478|nr:hypothetical protein [uncultured Gilliamella sp.]
MKKNYLLLLVIFLCSCQGIKSQDSSDSKKKNSIPVITLPFGTKKLIDVQFPANWKTYDYPSNTWYKTPIDLAYNNSDLFYDVYKNKNRDLKPTDSITYTYTYTNANMPNIYYDYFFPYQFIKKQTDILYNFEEILYPLWKINLSNNQSLIMLFSQGYSDQIEPYTIYFQKMQLMVVDNHGNKLDSMNAYLDTNRGYDLKTKRLYIDRKGIIHIKYFDYDVEDVNFFRYEKFQISPEGKFIRYYDQNGFFQNEEEQGLVENHTREGLWIEMKPNGYYTYPLGYTYLEANYQKGLPIGIWKFYKLDYQKKPDSSIDLSSGKKGKLLYTETYKDGELVERKFVDKEIDELN